MSQKEVGDKIKLVVADNVWLYVAISLPFTLCTVVIWWVWVQFQSGLIRLPESGILSGITEMLPGRGRQRFKEEHEA